MIDAQNGRLDEKDWLALVGEIEERMATLNGALDEVWASVRRLSTMQPVFATQTVSEATEPAVVAGLFDEPAAVEMAYESPLASSEPAVAEPETTEPAWASYAAAAYEDAPLMPRDSWPGAPAEAEAVEPAVPDIHLELEDMVAEPVEAEPEATAAGEDSEAPGIEAPASAPSMAWASLSDEAADDLESPVELEPEAGQDGVRDLVAQAKVDLEDGAFSWDGTLEDASSDLQAEGPAVEEDDAVRAEVQDLVAQARAEMAWGALVAEKEQPVAEVEPVVADEAATPKTEEARAEVIDFVAQARAELAALGEGWRLDPDAKGPPAKETSDAGGWAQSSMSATGSMWGRSPNEEKVVGVDPRDEVRSLVEQAKAELSEAGLDWEVDVTGGQIPSDAFDAVPAAEDASDEDEDAIREEVRRVVARARSELSDAMYDEPTALETVARPKDEDDMREEVRRAVEEAKAEMALSSFNLQMPAEDASEDAAVDSEADEEARREEVRRAVAAARAEIGVSRDLDGAGPSALVSAARDGTFLVGGQPMPGQSSADRWQAAMDAGAPMMPPTLVIEDTTGRVELARVYDTLNRIDCSAQASLLNYTPHSVTVGIGAQKRLPQPDVLEAAVRAVFGKSCRITSDGSRTSIKIGEGERAA